ncbi:putative receptor protein kinase ZmPK1 [Juglans microcarpa x Juglans regia]|uniref:putative receptor protein kinase ZmPK1 n=1 Tax=Juglans microcarpa x Juglans regia TaxID=2249226 RepID=UPI001B7E055D|nr:putative receptor protein kinase ZmPK1 [Juglans microcarpa x Juglans regia]
MDLPVLFLLLSLSFSLPLSSSSLDTIHEGTSLSIEKSEDILISPDGVFSAGFYSVGDNAYCYAIWFNKPSHSKIQTVIWMANRDHPVNGRSSKLSLLKTGNLILSDAGRFTVWATNTQSHSPVNLSLSNTGNLVLRNMEGVTLWESFDFPTDTLLPQQQLTRSTRLISSRSQTNYSSGFYKLFFDNDNTLRLLYDGLEVSSVCWPDPWLVSCDAGRSTYNSSRIAVLDTFGNFSSSDDFTFMAADYGPKLHRRLRIDYDGDVRLYSWDEEGQTWIVSWQVIQGPCKIYGICGENSLCSYIVGSDRKCSCLPGYKIKNLTDWSDGCEPEFHLSCNRNESGFLLLPRVEFFGYDYGYLPNYTFDQCKNLCLQLCNCKAFQFTFSREDGFSKCYPKTMLLNGYRSPDFQGDLYLRLPENNFSSYANYVQDFKLNCSSNGTVQQDRTYKRCQENLIVKFMLWFVCGVGGLEIICIFLVWCLLSRPQQASSVDKQGYLIAVTGFRRFTYVELKKATKDFNEEIGRGAGGIVYKGVLPDNRAVAIKRLNESNQGEGEFLAEVSIIGRINHMNLIEMWGYCAEGKRRLLVYEYMEHGTLAQNLSSHALDWKKRFDIAAGTAKGLAYLHEECLEWVLHCDVKPQNILLDSNYQPKVADFGLSKLQNRNLENASFSRIRGTRGYMAPEWVFNLPITSKVDVYSYGIVVLEMVTGKGPTKGVQATDSGGETEPKRLVAWVREKRNEAAAMASWVQEIVDPILEGSYEEGKMETLINVALQCVEEEKDARPSMRQVAEMLLCQENDSHNDDHGINL